MVWRLLKPPLLLRNKSYESIRSFLLMTPLLDSALLFRSPLPCKPVLTCHKILAQLFRMNLNIHLSYMTLNEDSTGGRVKPSAVSSLRSDHLGAFIRALSNMISTELAEVTLAQIVDGLPVPSSSRDLVESGIHDSHPVYTERTKLCPGVSAKTQEILKCLDPASLQLESAVMSIIS